MGCGYIPPGAMKCDRHHRFFKNAVIVSARAGFPPPVRVLFLPVCLQLSSHGLSELLARKRCAKPPKVGAFRAVLSGRIVSFLRRWLDIDAFDAGAFDLGVDCFSPMTGARFYFGVSGNTKGDL